VSGAGRNLRGNTTDRLRRRLWIIEVLAAQLGLLSKSGKTIRCFHCPRRMRVQTPKHPYGTFEVDRFPLCGHAGGRYVRGNIVPACKPCNGTRCTKRCRGRSPSGSYVAGGK
jgi:hypothetical protein